jgi:hypothetical protein
MPKKRAALGSPSLLEDALLRHPKLRVYAMLAGYPFLEDTIAFLHAAPPQVYVDLAEANWIIPRPVLQCSGGRLRNVSRALSIVAFLIPVSLLACRGATTDEERIDRARSQAEQLLEFLRTRQWAQAADFVLLDDTTRGRFRLSADTDATVIAKHVEELFRELYEGQPPGSIESVRIDPYETGDTKLTLVSYRHGDLDAFHMRLVNDRWLYSFE